MLYTPLGNIGSLPVASEHIGLELIQYFFFVCEQGISDPLLGNIQRTAK
jgi:hypothetical protein